MINAIPPQELSDLIARFSAQIDAYHAQEYKEASVRREFIDPFFKFLGWDIDNTNSYAEQYKDVVHEDALKIGALTKAPDYSFRIGGARKFFVEAKKPSVNIKEDASAAFQVRRYAWSAKLPVSILTNFNEFAVYDCRKKPEKTDNAATGRIMYIKYQDYVNDWSRIVEVFSREAILKGSFDRFVTSSKNKRGTSEVDDTFLSEIEGWREVLARNLALRNPQLNQRELNYSVQRTIDRIIFLRICEDRGIEPYGQLQALQNGNNTYPQLCQIFDRADERYNSGLFHFHPDKGRPETPDNLSFTLQIDDKVLKDIFKRLYYPDSPYEFSVLPADILGQVYEQFLGKVIRLTAGHQAKVEEKPEVKKAGGVFYTPTYIVDYIVQQTVGKLVEGNTPKEVASLRILDPACGSGSFLIGAYQFLLDWHLQWYLADGAEKHARGKNAPLIPAEGGWRLTTNERKRILLNNIYGVDIDGQAVEVTKLSLLLKVLEGETTASLDHQVAMFRQRALPDLAANIKCGNSLIGSDFYDNHQFTMLDEEEMYRVNAFDWSSNESGFGKIMKAGGFDAVIGNPPYVLLQDLFRDNDQLAYFRAKFRVASYKVDTYPLFMERGLYLLRSGGLFSMITPANYLTNNSLETLRRLLLTDSAIDHIAVIDERIFHGVSVDNAIFVVQGGTPTLEPFKVVHMLPAPEGLYETSTEEIRTDANQLYVLFTGSSGDILSSTWTRVLAHSDSLGTIADVNFGKQLRDRRKYLTDVVRVQSLAEVQNGYLPCYTGRDVARYTLQWNGLTCMASDKVRMGGCWDPAKQNASNKLITKQVGKVPEFGIDTRGYQCLNTVFMVTMLEHSPYDVLYVLGLLNSRLLKTLWLDKYWDRRRTFPKIKGTYLKKYPIRTIDFTNPADVASHERMMALVERMLDLNKKLAAVNTSQEKTVLRRQIEATDKQIDALVYELYGLTEEEIGIVEGS
ncbi:MAG: N-6 DNA methylase [bacterium]